MEMRGLEDTSPNRRMDGLARRGVENMSDRGMNLSVNAYDNIVGYSNMVNRNMENIDTRSVNISSRDMDRGMDSIAPRSYGTVATRNMDNISMGPIENYPSRSHENMTGVQSMENYGTSGIENVGGRGMEDIVARELDLSITRGSDNFAARGLDNIAPRGIDNIAARSMDNIGPRGMEDIVTRELDLSATRVMDNIATRSIDNIATGGMNNIATRGMDNIATRSVDNIPARDMQTIATHGIETIPSPGMENIAATDRENIAARDMESITADTMEKIASGEMDNIAGSSVGNVAHNTDGQSVTRADTLTAESVSSADKDAVSPSNYDGEIQITQDHITEDISESKFAEKVDEIVQNLEDKMDDSYSVNGDKSENLSLDQSEDIKPTPVATKFVHIIDDHSETFRYQMHQQWLKGQYCDFVLKVKDRDIKVHACVMAAFIPVIHQLKKTTTLCFPEMRHSAILPLIKMMYTGILCFDLADAPYVAVAAKRLMLSDIYTACQDYISECQKSGLSPGDYPSTMQDFDMEEDNPDYNQDKSTQISGDDEEVPKPIVRKAGRGRPRRNPGSAPRKKYAKRGRPPKMKMALVPNEVKDEDGTEIPGLMTEEKVVLSLQDEDEDVDVDNVDEENPNTPVDWEKKSYVTRSQLWPHKKRTSVMKWLMSRRKDKLSDKTKPKHTKRDQSGRLKCPGCSETYETSDELQTHIETSTQHNAFRCGQCGIAYIRKSNLTRHMRTVHSSAFHLKCRFCDISTKTERELRNHCIESHSSNTPFQCEHPGCSYRTYKYDFLRRHTQIHSDHKDYVCHKCGKTFAQQAGLLSHHRTCYHLQEYLCDLCGQAFNHYQSMKSHRRSIHLGERPFMCSDCGTRFSDHRNLKRHRRIHENMFPYSCHVCGQKYRHSNSLKAHMKKHSDVMSAEAAATSALISTYTSAEMEISAQYSHPPPTHTTQRHPAHPHPTHPHPAHPHPHPPPITLPPLPLNQLHEYYASACDKYASACDKYGPMTSMSSVIPSSVVPPSMVPSSLPLVSNTIPTTMNTTGTSVGLDTLADLCLSSSVV